MLKSMTGYAKLSRPANIGSVQFEIKCVNSKYCDISLKLPKVLSYLDIPIRNLLQDRLLRGKIEAFLEIHFLHSQQTPILNRAQFISTLNLLDQMKTLGGLQDAIALSHILSFNELVEYKSEPIPPDSERELLQIIEEAASQLDAMRVAEGGNLETIIRSQLARLGSAAAVIQNAKEQVFTYWFERFKHRIAEFIPEHSAIDDRLIQEAALLAEKADITEEVDRINSHCKQFVYIMENEYPCGKKLDFLCQELYRELNTTASKSQRADIINNVIEAKSIVDSVREQLQNIV
jgi:uncharacterized protein (TIGR00255 family)